MFEVGIELRYLEVVIVAVSKGSVLATSPVIDLVVFVHHSREAATSIHANHFWMLAELLNRYWSVVSLTIPMPKWAC